MIQSIKCLRCYVTRGGGFESCDKALHGGRGSEILKKSCYVIYGWPLIDNMTMVQ